MFSGAHWWRVPSFNYKVLFIYILREVFSLPPPPHNSQADGSAVLPPIYLIRDMVKFFPMPKWLLYLALFFAPFGGLCGHVNAVLSRRTPCLVQLVTLPLSTGKPSKATSKNMCNTAGTERGFFTWNATPVAFPFFPFHFHILWVHQLQGLKQQWHSRFHGVIQSKTLVEKSFLPKALMSFSGLWKKIAMLPEYSNLSIPRCLFCFFCTGHHRTVPIWLNNLRKKKG